jgi:uncharacterized SAM-binding protein YcdF (DUF218 family)
MVKKVLGALLMPLPVSLALATVGWILWAKGKHRRAGQLLAGAALVLLCGLSFAPVSAWLARPLEHEYAPFSGDSVDYVVVLGSGHDSDPTLPVSSRLSSAGLYRLVEGVRIAVAEPWAGVIFSGYGGPDPRPNALVYRDVALSLGLDSTRIRVEPSPHDTHEEAMLMAPTLRGHRFALVTSAMHMPRAMALFRAEGLDPVAAPTGFLTATPQPFGWTNAFPDEGALLVSRTAWYERLGRMWMRLRGG